MDLGKERFLRNYNRIKFFAENNTVPEVNVWDFINAVADLFYNFRREKIVSELKANSKLFTRFMRKNLPNTVRCEIFFTIPTAIRGVLIHLLNNKILRRKRVK